jgi:two-component system cell cycle response regulator DivK
MLANRSVLPCLTVMSSRSSAPDDPLESGRRPSGSRRRRKGPRPRPHGHGLVLIVDDAVDAREMYSQHFRHHGYAALTAPDGATGIEAALRTKPDVIVMDVAMPGMSGVSAAHHIRHHPRTRRIPIIILTGHPSRTLELGALEMGADLFLTKPCLPDDLEAEVKKLIDVRRRS